MLEQLSDFDLSEIDAELSAAERAILEFGPVLEKLRRKLDAEKERRALLARP